MCKSNKIKIQGIVNAFNKRKFNFCQKNESLFVSLKYLDSEGNLNQIDSAAKNILTDPHNHGFELSKNICLLPIDSKGFCDPFRSLPTY